MTLLALRLQADIVVMHFPDVRLQAAKCWQPGAFTALE